MVAELKFLVAQGDRSPRTRGARFGGLTFGLVARLGEPLPDPGTEGQLEVQSGGDGGRRLVCPGAQVGVARSHHLHHQAGVERMGGVDVFGESRRHRRKVELEATSHRTSLAEAITAKSCT